MLKYIVFYKSNAEGGSAVNSFFAESELFANIGLQKKDVFFYSVTDSTNTRAREFFNGGTSSKAALFVAERQTGGKGTRGRSFESEKGGLYFSLLLHGELDSLPLTVMAAGAVYLSLSKMLGRKKSKALFIKWVNDLYIGEKKISGILSEKINGEYGKAYIVGIGINLFGSPFTPELSKIASSVEAATGVRIDGGELLLRICKLLLSVGNRRTEKRLCRAYRRHSIKRGRKITVTDSGGVSRDAAVIGLGKDFSLKVRYSDGKTASLVSGDISVKI